MNKYLKTGGCSVVVGDFHYGSFIPAKFNKLVKISKKSNRHNEFKHINEIKGIANYKNYYSLPEEILGTLNPGNDFFEYLKNIVSEEETYIFYYPLYYFYIDNAGDKELLDTMDDLMFNNDKTYWKTYKDVYVFTKHILYGLSYLHEKKMCHLDIKPENIMVDTSKRTYRIIDFGFCSIEPFLDFRNNPRGTPGYFPNNVEFDYPTEWLPRFYTNDLILFNGYTPIQKFPELVYRIDSILFGRTLFFLMYAMNTQYQNKSSVCCFSSTKKIKRKLDKIVKSLLCNNIYKRLTIEQCLTQFKI